MKFIKVLLALPASLAVPFLPLDAREVQDAKQVSVTVQHHRTTSKTKIVITDMATSELLAQMCSDDALNSGASTTSAATSGTGAFPVALDIDWHGAGNITVDGHVYRVHENPELSGGISCIRAFDDDELLVRCDHVPLPTSSLRMMTPTKKDDLDCFAGTMTGNLHWALAETAEDVDGGYAPFSSGFAATTNEESNHTSLQERGKRNLCSPHYHVDLIGNGNPHQNYLHTQLSENIACGSARSCSVGHEQSKSYTIGWSASGGGASWISGGFSVAKSWNTGHQYTCYAGKQETACVWYKTAHTAYTVGHKAYNHCTATGCTGNCPAVRYILFSPNKNNKGGGYYCVIGTCRSQGASYWVKKGRAGGP